MSVTTKLVDLVVDINEQVNENPFKDKWVSILGDSISTFKGYIPADHDTFYPNGNVDKVEKTWWHLLLTSLGAKLCVNAAFSGKQMSGSGGAVLIGHQVSDIYRKKGQSYINLDGTSEVATQDIYPDIVLIFGGINDYRNNATISEPEKDNFWSAHDENSYSVTGENDFTHDYSGTILALLNQGNDKAGKLPDVYCCLLPNFSGWNTPNTASLVPTDYNNCIKLLCDYWGINYIDTSKFTVFTLVNKDITVGDRLHPNEKGMRVLARLMKKELLAKPPQRSPIEEITL